MNAEIMALLHGYKPKTVHRKQRKVAVGGKMKNSWLEFVKDYRLKHGPTTLKIISQHYKKGAGLVGGRKKSYASGLVGGKKNSLVSLKNMAKKQGHKLSHIVNGKRKMLNKKQLIQLLKL